MDLNPIDPEPYVRPPRLAVDSGLSLAKKLMRVVPSKPTPGVQQGATLLAQSVTALESAWHGSGKARPRRNARPADLRLDRAWAAVHARLTAWTIFPVDDPDHETSTAIAERLFPTGLEFLRLPFLAEHAQSERRVQIIESEALREDLDHLVGEVFMDELLAAHAAYGEALGITKAGETAAPEPTLDDPLRRLSQAIAAYSLQVVAFAALPGNAEAGRRALGPIDEFRAAVRRAGGGGRAEEMVDGGEEEGDGDGDDEGEPGEEEAYAAVK